ncbi:MAG TPA: ribonuclease P protein component [Myxococcota bacterium]|nr:ribonuclease P protein component [Myxococcota bacterium]HOD07093.1 ribonuclease P protein component [Myxococcota bacterium]HPB51003.1 ribonuclease P protein component [Myxococcota bacterium]HQP96802.1 ribonuclease P protein component [Myxococcota bacterium]
MDRGFPKSCRVLLPRDFNAVMKGGFKAWTWNLIVFSGRNGLQTPRLGLAVSRKIGNAVARNRWKRLIREVFRNSLKSRLVGRDFIVAVKAVPGFDRNKGPGGVNRKGQPAVSRQVPALADLEGELADALRRIDRKMGIETGDGQPDSLD